MPTGRNWSISSTWRFANKLDRQKAFVGAAPQHRTDPQALRLYSRSVQGSVQGSVEGGARAHDGLGLHRGGDVVAADVRSRIDQH